MPQHRLFGLRGQKYIERYKQIIAEDGAAIRAEFERIVQQNGKFSPRDLGALCNRFQLPVKLMDDCLPSLTECRYPSGTWERLTQAGVKARDIGVSWSDRDG